jgi:hypothetical protein
MTLQPAFVLTVQLGLLQQQQLPQLRLVQQQQLLQLPMAVLLQLLQALALQAPPPQEMQLQRILLLLLLPLLVRCCSLHCQVCRQPRPVGTAAAFAAAFVVLMVLQAVCGVAQHAVWLPRAAAVGPAA